MHSPERNPLLARLEPLVGTWRVTADIPGSEGLEGRAEFEWVLDGRFLAERSEAPDPVPDGFMLVGVDETGEGYTQHYFDSRGIARVYAMTFADGLWTLERQTADFTPLSFAQRFTGHFSEDANTIEGRWEKAEDGSSWEKDFDLTLARLA